MFKCNKGTTQKVSLENKILEPISINFSGPILKFNQLEGVFQLTDNPFAKKDNSKSKVDFNKLNADLQEIELRVEALKDVKERMTQNLQKITEETDWLQYMVKCDLLDKEYLEEMKENLGDYKQTIDEVHEVEVNTTSGDQQNINEHHHKIASKSKEETIHISDVESEKDIDAEGDSVGHGAKESEAIEV